MADEYVSSYILPEVAKVAPGYVHDVLVADTQRGTMHGSIGALQTVTSVRGFAYLLGGLVFGIALYRANVLARWAAALLAVGGVISVALLYARCVLPAPRVPQRHRHDRPRLLPVARRQCQRGDATTVEHGQYGGTQPVASRRYSRRNASELVAMSTTKHEAAARSSETTAPRAPGPELHAPSPAEQRTARIMGAWFLGTFVFSIPAFFFYDPVLKHPGYVIGSGHDSQVAVGALLEIMLAVSGIATAVVIFPIVKRVNESTALGYIASRTVESILILVGVLSLMSIVALRQELHDAANPGSTIDVSRGLLAIHDQTSMLGPQFCAGLGNGILLGYLMWKSRLLPRPMVLFGLIGGPLAVIAGAGVLLQAWDSHDGLPVLMTVPEIIWEFSLSVTLLIWGFNASPILTGATVTREKQAL